MCSGDERVEAIQPKPPAKKTNPKVFFHKTKSLHYFDLTSTNISIVEVKAIYGGGNGNIEGGKRKD